MFDTIVIPEPLQALPCVGPAYDVPFLLDNIVKPLLLPTTYPPCIKLFESLSQAFDLGVNCGNSNELNESINKSPEPDDQVNIPEDGE